MTRTEYLESKSVAELEHIDWLMSVSGGTYPNDAAAGHHAAVKAELVARQVPLFNFFDTLTT